MIFLGSEKDKGGWWGSGIKKLSFYHSTLLLVSALKSSFSVTEGTWCGLTCPFYYLSCSFKKIPRELVVLTDEIGVALHM